MQFGVALDVNNFTNTIRITEVDSAFNAQGLLTTIDSGKEREGPAVFFVLSAESRGRVWCALSVHARSANARDRSSSRPAIS